MQWREFSMIADFSVKVKLKVLHKVLQSTTQSKTFSEHSEVIS